MHDEGKPPHEEVEPAAADDEVRPTGISDRSADEARARAEHEQRNAEFQQRLLESMRRKPAAPKDPEGKK